MKMVLLALLAITFFSGILQAKGNRGNYGIKEALSTESAKSTIDKKIKLYWGKQKHPAIKNNLGVIKVSEKASAFNKSDKEVCQLILLSAVKQLQKKAKAMGANAIINIKSNYKNNLRGSTKVFECGAGSLIAGVALVGTAVNLATEAPKAK